MRVIRNERGSVLLLVLVIVALLASLLTEFAFSTLVDIRLTETFRDSSRAYYLAKGGIRVGRVLLQEDKNSYDAQGETWSLGVVNYPVGEGFVTIQIEDQGGKLDINRLVDTLGVNPNSVFIDRFNRFFDLLGLPEPEDLTAALIDWIDRDEEIYQGEGLGAESEYYQGLVRPYPCKNAPLDSMDELELIRGFTPEIIRLVRPHLTVHGGDEINVNTATAEVLMSLSADPEIDRTTAEDIIALREARPFMTSEDLKELNRLPGMDTLLRTSFAVTSPTYIISSWATVNDGSRSMEGVVRKSGDQLLFLKVN
ncbi:MAG: type II secretion system minor pseudopilin GspK [Desulfuromonadales bacterium]|nr:type II secretion system minor pseudopilin GspK [Desulfuromonadales bacterium]MDW7757345.1 type II secretion system minor pseudopilin GspK [Desulfuromonadales bacterium]